MIKKNEMAPPVENTENSVEPEKSNMEESSGESGTNEKAESLQEKIARLQEELGNAQQEYEKRSQGNDEIRKRFGDSVDLGESAREEALLEETIEEKKAEIGNLRDDSEEETKDQEKGGGFATEGAANDLEKMPVNERGAIEKIAGSIGFRLEKWKASGLNMICDIASKAIPEGNVKTFVESLAKTYKKDAEIQERKMDNARSDEGQKLLKNSNRIAAGVNVLKIVSFVANGTMMGTSALFARGMEAAKEMRFGNEEVLEKNRVDVEKAQEEAWSVYEEARKNSGNEKPAKNDLQRAYESSVPKDVLDRLSKNFEPGTGRSFLTGILKKPIEFSARSLNKQIEAIDKGNLSEEQKKAKRDKLLDGYSKKINDLDRIISQSGELDSVALGLKYAEIAGKTVMAGVMAKTVYDGLEGIWNKIGDAFSSLEGEGGEEIASIVENGEMTAWEKKEFDFHKELNEEWGNIFSDEEMKEMHLYGGREDKAAERFEHKAFKRMYDNFRKDFAMEGEGDSWIDADGEHVKFEKEGVVYEYVTNQDGKTIDEKISGKPEGIQWKGREKRFVLDKEGARMMRRAMEYGADAMDEDFGLESDSAQEVEAAEPTARKGVISSGGADFDAM